MGAPCMPTESCRVHVGWSCREWLKIVETAIKEATAKEPKAATSATDRSSGGRVRQPLSQQSSRLDVPAIRQLSERRWPACGPRKNLRSTAGIANRRKTAGRPACGASDLMLTKNMVRSTPRKRKRRGRPRTGVRPMVGVRVSNETRAAVKRWAEMQVDKPTLSEALRRLIDIGLRSLNAFE